MAAAPWQKVAPGVLAVLAAAAFLVVVTDDPGADPDPARPGPSPRPTVQLVGESLWSRVGDLSTTPGTPAARDGLVLVARDGLTLVELSTGRARWTVPAGARLAGSSEVYSSGGTLVGAGVLVRTRTGIALLSRDDAGVRWRAPVRAAAGERYVLAAADDRTALVTVGPTRGGVPRVVALDVRTGRPRWAREGLSPSAIAGDVVVGVRVGAGVGSAGRDGPVTAWHLATGATAWTLTGFTTARVALTAGESVLVEGRTPQGTLVRRAVRAATGAPLADLGGDPRAGLCATDDRTLIACPHGRAVETFDGHRRQTYAGDFQARSVCLVGPDHVFAADATSYFALDRRGRPVASYLPGRPVAVSGDHLVLRGDAGDPPVLSVYELAS
jgi:hypothetical protein